MAYEYIRNYYGIDVPVGTWVQHDVTGRFGTVMPEDVSNAHYVQVKFEGDRWSMPCHPGELDYDVVGGKAGAA